jgi:hypothetical protein
VRSPVKDTQVQNQEKNYGYPENGEKKGLALAVKKGNQEYVENRLQWSLSLN